MADYYPLIARAVEGIPEARRRSGGAVYERARTALMQQLRSLDPPLSEADIERERAVPRRGDRAASRPITSRSRGRTRRRRTVR